MLLAPIDEGTEVGVARGVVHVSQKDYSSSPLPQGSDDLSKA